MSCEGEVSEGLRAHVAADEGVARLRQAHVKAGQSLAVQTEGEKDRRPTRSIYAAREGGLYSLAPRWHLLCAAGL